MKPYQRISLIVACGLLVLTIVGLVMTSEWGSRTVALARHGPRQQQSPVDMHQMQAAMALAPLASSPEEQDLARDALRMADHEVDFEFTSALYQATAKPVPSTPEIRAIQDRISKAEKSGAEIDSEIARVTKFLSSANEIQKPILQQQLDLVNARKELNDDELADAKQDLESAGGDPKSRIQRLVDEHNAAQQDNHGQLDLSAVGKQASSTLPESSSLISRVKAWYTLRSVVNLIDQAQQEADAKAVVYSARHDQLEHQVEELQAQQLKKLPAAPSSDAIAQKSGSAQSTASGQTDAAISSYRSLTALQKRMSFQDSRIRNEQNLSSGYAKWGELVTTRERGLLHSLLQSVAAILLIVLAVLIADRYMQRAFDRLEPDRKKLLTLRAVADIVTRAVGAILILLVIFGFPNQTATVVALAGAGLTVALKDFIVGFFGWFVLMGKNGIRHGDWVEINGVSGEVIEIGLFHTVLLETGNWNDSGHPTGRRVTFINSYAIEGHYFNFSTSGQWLWDEVQVSIPADRDPYAFVEEIQKVVTKETEANTKLAEQEWEKMGNAGGMHDFSAGPAINVRPSGSGFEILIRYVTRANLRYQQRSKLYFEIVELLRQKNVQQPTSTPPVAAPTEALS
jgi:small-conductance mechanosensitive channel